MSKLKISCWIVSFLLLSFLGNSQTLNLNEFGIEEGLPQSSVYTMLHDKEGNIWVGTMAGVSKYNGLSFESFTKKNGLAENRVVSGFIDNKGNIWFGHWAGGISVYNTNTKLFQEINPSNINLYKPITSITQTSNGTIWFGTDGLGLIKHEPADEEAGLGPFAILSKKDGLSSNNINALVEKNGILWIATDNGISKYDLKTKSISYFNSENGLPSNSIKSLYLDADQNLWIGSSDKGAFKLNSKNNNLIIYNASKGLSSNYIKVIFQDNDKNIFLGTYGGGVFKYLPTLEANNYKGPIFQTISTKQGLSSDKILSIIQDREKNIWIGTSLNLNQYFDEQFEIYGAQEGLENSLVWSVIQDSKGVFWLGTEGGLTQFKQDPNSNKNSFISFNDSKVKVANTTALYEDKNGYIWYSNFANGASRLNPITKQVKTYTTKDGLKSNEVYCITGDRDGNVWIGTNKGGVSKFDLQKEKFTTYTIADGLGSNQIYSILKDKKDRIWLGGLSGSLTMYDGKTFKTFSSKDGYDNKFTVCMTEDASGNIWFGTYDGGIYKYDGANFKNYTSKQGLSSDMPFLLICDNKNNLWIGTGLGIDKFNLKDETFKHYSKQDGFLGIEINPNAVCKDNEGNIWFGSIIGLVKYNSKLEKNNLIEPVTYIKPPRINFNIVDIPQNHEFKYDQNHFTFDFIGTSLTNPKRVKYKFMLEGMDKDFSMPVKDNYITYPSLPPGSYTFKVKSCNNDGIWNKEPVTFSFTITPPWWKTWWFYTLSVIISALSIFFIIKIREKRLKEKNQELEKKVEERTEEINLQKIELETKNANITDSIDYAKRIQEAIFLAPQQIKKILPQSFILFKPKDIVSGDFYWIYDNGDKIFFAAVDCTGHGVPGAFMSIVSYNLLNRIVLDLGITSPAAILNELDKLVVETLNRKANSENSKEVKDGMDIAICAWDVKNKKMEFAGAYNPLYHIRKGELVEYKADKLPIGKSSIHKEGQFTSHEIALEKDDMLYLFSDGYADQIGGPKRKKFYYGPFKELLLSISKKSMEDQRSDLDKTIKEWLGNREQVDDIIVMGVRV